MGHFVLGAADVQIHLYCRDADTYEKIFEAAEEAGSILQVRAGEEHRIPESERRVHLFVRDAELYAVNHEGSRHPGPAFKLDDPAALALEKAFPSLLIPADRLLPSAPFAAGMLPVLTDF